MKDHNWKGFTSKYILLIFCIIFNVHIRVNIVTSFSPTSNSTPVYRNKSNLSIISRSTQKYHACNIFTTLHESNDDNKDDTILGMSSQPKIQAAKIIPKTINIEKPSETSSSSTSTTNNTAKTNTINERLLSEIATRQENPTNPNKKSKYANAFQYSNKTPEEREAAIAAARDLNGVNPTVTILASFFAFGMAYGFWILTQFFADLFLTHPLSPDAPYTFQRIASVIRNVVIGLSSLASGFAAVTGLGVFLLGVRVAYGVMKGELDPTPTKKDKMDLKELPNVWDLMMNKKPSRRNRGSSGGDNPFGL